MLFFGLPGLFEFRLPQGSQWLWVLLLGLVALGVHSFIILAYRFSTSMLIGALDYLRIVWALAFGFFIFNEKPLVPELIGITMICASGLISVTQMRNPKAGEDKF